MTDSARKRDNTDAPADAVAVRSAGRRRLLKSGIATAPVVLTLTSRPVLGWTCRSSSAVGSGNASNPGQTITGGTLPLTIAGWDSAPSFPAPYSQANTKFNDVFAGGSSDKYTKVLRDAGREFEKHMVAASLNIANNATVAQCLTLVQLKEMWAGRSGTYSPVAGVLWGQTEIVAYLQGNTIVPV